jgi:DNA-directed RNA polymerase subunit H (RpoH/RPB5)
MADNSLGVQVTKAVVVLSEMMTDRGISDHALQSFDPDDCLNAVLRRETIQIEVTADTLLVMYITARQNGTSIRADLKKRIEPRHTRCILVFRDVPINISTIADKLKTEFEDVRKIEVFSINELQYNVTKHVLVPLHRRIDPNAVPDVLRTYGIKRHQLPLILHTDAVCRYLGVEPGDVIEVHRISPAAGVHVAHRLCV